MNYLTRLVYPTGGREGQGVVCTGWLGCRKWNLGQGQAMPVGLDKPAPVMTTVEAEGGVSAR